MVERFQGDEHEPSTVEVAVSALRRRAHLLETRLRPARKGAPAPLWTSDPAVREVMQLQNDARTTAKHLLLGDASDVLKMIGVQMVIDDQDASYLDQIAGFALSPYVPLQAETIQALGRLGGHRHLPLITAALEREPVFWAAVEAVAVLGGDDALPLVERALARFDDPWDRLDVIMLVGDVGGPWVLPLLVRILGDPHEPFPPVRGYAAQTLALRRGADFLPQLVEALADPSLIEKGRVLWAIGTTRAPAGYEAVAPFLAHAEKEWYRAEALKAMAQCDPERAAPVVWAAATEDAFFRSDAEVFRDVLGALAVARPADTVYLLTDVLRAALGDPLPLVAAESRVAAGWQVPDVVVHAGPRFVVNVLDALCQVFDVVVPPLDGRHSPAAIAHHQAHTLLNALLALSEPELGELELTVGRLAAD